jgi:hypothetical protein
MGMYDYIKVKVPLPDGWIPNEEGETLQTKDFDCQLVTHTITEEGKFLFEEIVEYKEVPLTERPFPEANDWRSFVGSVETITNKYFLPTSKTIRFYGIEGDVNTDNWKWHEYRAIFQNGQLTEITIYNDHEFNDHKT